MIKGITKLALMIQTGLGVLLPAMIGGLLMLTAVVFCDVGPLSRCARMGAEILVYCAVFSLVSAPALFALISESKRLDWYLWIFPLLALALAFWVHKQVSVPNHILISVAYECTAFCAVLYLYVSRRTEEDLP